MEVSDDLKYLARLLLMKHNTASQGRTEITGSKEPWVVTEELMCASVPMEGAQMGTGSVPKYDVAQWVRFAYGAIRIVSRDKLGTKFALCLPLNYNDILSKLKADEEPPEPDLIVFRYLDVSTGKGPLGMWMLTYSIHAPSGTELNFGFVEGKYMEQAVRAVIEKALETKRMSDEVPVKEPWRFSLRFRTGPYRFIVLVCFLIHTYWIGMHSFLSSHNAQVLALWLVALVVLMLFDKGGSE